MSAPTKAVGLGVLVLLVAVSVPMMVTVSDGSQSYTVELEEGENTFVRDRINVTSENIRPPQPANATITVEDTQTLESETQVIANGSTGTYEFRDGNVTVNVTDVSDGPEVVRATVGVERTYGWSGPAKTVASNLELLFAVVGGIIILGAVRVVIQ